MQGPNNAAQLFTAAEAAYLGLLPQGQPEPLRRVTDTVAEMEEQAFGSYTKHQDCEALCPWASR